MREHPAVAISLQLMCFLGPLGVCDGQEGDQVIWPQR
jgi:hypothetical protein